MQNITLGELANLHHTSPECEVGVIRSWEGRTLGYIASIETVETRVGDRVQVGFWDGEDISVINFVRSEPHTAVLAELS